MTGRLVDISFSLNRKQRITLEVDSDFRNLWDKLNQEPLLDIEIKKHRNKRSHNAKAACKNGLSAKYLLFSMFLSTRSPPKLANRTTL